VAPATPLTRSSQAVGNESTDDKRSSVHGHPLLPSPHLMRRRRVEHLANGLARHRMTQIGRYIGQGISTNGRYRLVSRSSRCAKRAVRARGQSQSPGPYRVQMCHPPESADCPWCGCSGALPTRRLVDRALADDDGCPGGNVCFTPGRTTECGSMRKPVLVTT
jgi:hypothetical protein